MLSWVTSVEAHLVKRKANPKAMKECFDQQVDILTMLIKMVQGDLDKPLRQKIMCLITMDSHSRDIIEKLDLEEVMNSDEF